MQKHIRKPNKLLNALDKAFDKAFTWSRCTKLLLILLIFYGLVSDASLFHGVEHLFPLDDRTKAAVFIGFLVPLIFSFYHGCFLFVWYFIRTILTSSKEVPGNE